MAAQLIPVAARAASTPAAQRIGAWFASWVAKLSPKKDAKLLESLAARLPTNVGKAPAKIAAYVKQHPYTATMNMGTAAWLGYDVVDKFLLDDPTFTMADGAVDILNQIEESRKAQDKFAIATANIIEGQRDLTLAPTDDETMGNLEDLKKIIQWSERQFGDAERILRAHRYWMSFLELQTEDLVKGLKLFGAVR